MTFGKEATKNASEQHGSDETRKHDERCEHRIHRGILSRFVTVPRDRIHVRRDFHMMDGIWFVAVGDETPKAKKCGARGNEVKA